MKCSASVDGLFQGAFDGMSAGVWNAAQPDNTAFNGDSDAYQRYITNYRFAFIAFGGSASSVPLMA